MLGTLAEVHKLPKLPIGYLAMKSGNLPSKYIRDVPNSNVPNVSSPFVWSIIEYTTYLLYLCLLSVYIPYLVLLHISTPRPFPSWTLKRRISNRLNKLRVTLLADYIPPQPRGWDDWSFIPDNGPYLQAQADGEITLEVVKIDPVKKEYIRGIADVQQVRSIERPGFWISPKNAAGKGDEIARKGGKVILHLHGGGYIRGHPLWTPFPMEIAKSTGLRCLSMNYRKTLSSSSAFPAPLLDALAAYVHLTQKLHFEPSNIILSGESAGAHLILFLSQYLRDLDQPQIGYMILSSPWSDFTLSYPSYISNAPFDTVSPRRLGTAIRSATRYYTPEFLNSSYASPAKMPRGGWRYLQEKGVRVYVHYGGRELFCNEIEVLVRGMKKDGVNIRLRMDPDGLHTSGMNGEAGEVFKKDLLDILV